jgi:murein DD-endopeptidase MepM/ murein hydrolase activator NlpD
MPYEVKPGDTLAEIGSKYGVPWSRIAEANGISDPSQLRVGEMLKIPGQAPAPDRRSPEPQGQEAGIWGKLQRMIGMGEEEKAPTSKASSWVTRPGDPFEYRQAADGMYEARRGGRVVNRFQNAPGWLKKKVGTAAPASPKPKKNQSLLGALLENVTDAAKSSGEYVENRITSNLTGDPKGLFMLFQYALAGRDGVIDEGNYGEAELRAMGEGIARALAQGQTHVDYEQWNAMGARSDYGTTKQRGKKFEDESALHSMMTTIGGANFHMNDDGSATLTDKYEVDFTPAEAWKLAKQAYGKGDYAGAFSRLLQAGVNPARSFINAGEGEETTRTQPSAGHQGVPLTKDYRPVEVRIPAKYIQR